MIVVVIIVIIIIMFKQIYSLRKTILLYEVFLLIYNVPFVIFIKIKCANLR